MLTEFSGLFCNKTWLYNELRVGALFGTVTISQSAGSTA